jgi:hypothetical protein
MFHTVTQFLRLTCAEDQTGKGRAFSHGATRNVVFHATVVRKIEYQAVNAIPNERITRLLEINARSAERQPFRGLSAIIAIADVARLPRKFDGSTATKVACRIWSLLIEINVANNFDHEEIRHLLFSSCANRFYQTDDKCLALSASELYRSSDLVIANWLTWISLLWDQGCACSSSHYSRFWLRWWYCVARHT